MSNIPNNSLIPAADRSRLATPTASERGNDRVSVGRALLMALADGEWSPAALDPDTHVTVGLLVSDCPAQIGATWHYPGDVFSGTVQLSTGGMDRRAVPGGEIVGTTVSGAPNIIVTTPGADMVPSVATLGAVPFLRTFLYSLTVPETGWLATSEGAAITPTCDVDFVANAAVLNGWTPAYDDPDVAVRTALIPAALMTAEIYATRRIVGADGTILYVVGVYEPDA